jgi:hypothetical protein
MNEFELDAELASANPIDDREAASLIPPSLGEAMLREITHADQDGLWQRITGPLVTSSGPARLGFVGVLAVVAVALSALTALSFGGGAEELAEPAGTGVTEQIDPSGQNPPADQETLTIEVTTTTTPVEVESSSTTQQSDTADTAVSDEATACYAAGATKEGAASDYGRSCTQPMLNCELIDDVWVCSSEKIDTSLPGSTWTGGDDQLSTPPATATPTPTTAPNANNPTAVGAQCVTIEAEALQIVGAWSRRDDGSASGGTYVEWEGLSREANNGAPADVINTTFNISSPGTYRFIWAMRQPGDVASDKANDSWLNFPDADRFGPVSGGTYGGFVKIFGNSKDGFGWSAKADHNHVKSDVAIEFGSAGQYTMQIGGRSHGHQIDKIVIYRDSISQADAIAGRCAGSTSSPAAEPVTSNMPDVAVSRPYDSDRDLISLHYDHAPDRDDGHATVAGKVVTDSLGITPWVVGGAYGRNKASYQVDSEAVMDITWGSNWTNAHADWDEAVQATADTWQTTLNRGGDIWIAEGGQSDLSADVVRELLRRDASIDTANRIHLVQHSAWNENKTTSSDLSYVRDNTNYVRIDDGNDQNGTADLNAATSGWEDRALESRWGAAWEAAFAYLDPNTRLDFSDTVELLHIVGIGSDEIVTTNDFADRFFR